MKRRTILKTGFGLAISAPLLAAMNHDKLHAAADVLQHSTDSGRIKAASIYVRQQQTVFTRSFGAAESEDVVFLLASISKPITIAAVMTLLDQGFFDLDETNRKQG